MSKDLLEPRVMIIADYEGNTKGVGIILTGETFADYPIKYPANFRELYWWEYREENELPLFVKTIYNGTVNKVHLYEIEEDTIHMIYPEGICMFGLRNYLIGRLPATEQEYQEYISQQK